MKYSHVVFFIVFFACFTSQATATTQKDTIAHEYIQNLVRDADSRACFLSGAVQNHAPKNTPAPLSNEALAKKLANPVATMISVPFQFNYDRNIGSDDKGKRFLLNIQPVVPFSISEDWNIISRTILPVIHQEDVIAGEGDQTGLGDIAQSIFFSPKEKTENGWIIGVGPIVTLPTATNSLLGSEKWGIGPTFVGLKQDGPWTYGVLANHVWSVAGKKDRSDISASFIQPFVSYTTPDAVTFSLQTESSYNWETEQWSVPIEGVVSKLTKIGNQSVNFYVGLKYWADSPDSGPEGIGFRAGFTLLFPQ